MPAPLDNDGSAQRPVEATLDLQAIIVEGDREIARQVREAVEKAVTSGVAVDPARMRKWGPGGAKYFVKKLRERIMPPLLPAVVAAKGSPSSAAKLDQVEIAEAPKSVTSSRRSTALIKTKKDWIHQEHGRWSIATRAIVRGLLIAMMLLIAAVLISRMPF